MPKHLKTRQLKLQISSYTLTLSWLSLFVISILCSTCILLGNWQLHRAKEKQIIQHHFANNPSLPELNIKSITTNPKLDYRKVKLKGTFNTKHQLLLDNRTHNHHPGFEVLIPFQPNNTQYTILVNRGWIAKHQQVQTPKPPSTLKGQLYFLKGKPFVLKDLPIQNKHWPTTIQAVNFKKITTLLKTPIQPFLILIDPTSPLALTPNNHPTTMPPSRHIGYAIQWFAFALIIIIIYLRLNLRKNNEKSSDK